MLFRSGEVKIEPGELQGPLRHAARGTAVAEHPFQISAGFESGLGFLVAWSWKMSKEMRRFGLEKKYY